MTEATDQPTVTIIGCGYVGLTTAAIFAQAGMKVYALEVNPERLAVIRSGRSFFYEAGIDALIAAGLASGNLIPTDSYDASVPHSDVVFSCVGTPDKDDGSSNLSYVYDAAERCAALMRDGAVYTQKSTVPVGTGAALQKVFARSRPAGMSVRYVSNPEFLSESTAVADTLWPDRVVTGSDDVQAAEQVAGLYRRVEERRQAIAATAGVSAPAHASGETRYIATGQSSAELIKVSSNAFLALKISFANSIAKLTDQTDADITEVLDAVGADRRIGRAFLNAGRGYGGGCFPKDVSSLVRSAEDHGVDLAVMRAAADVNASMPHYIIRKAELAFGRPLEDIPVGVLGVAFKAGTSDVRRSPGIAIANSLADLGARVAAYDPEAMAEADDLQPAVRRCDSAADALHDAEIIFVATDWPEFKEMGVPGLAQTSKATLVVDCMNCLDKHTAPDGLSYIGVGR